MCALREEREREKEEDVDLENRRRERGNFAVGCSREQRDKTRAQAGIIMRSMKSAPICESVFAVVDYIGMILGTYEK